MVKYRTLSTDQRCNTLRSSLFSLLHCPFCYRIQERLNSLRAPIPYVPLQGLIYIGYIYYIYGLSTSLGSFRVVFRGGFRSRCAPSDPTEQPSDRRSQGGGVSLVFPVGRGVFWVCLERTRFGAHPFPFGWGGCF